MLSVKFIDGELVQNVGWNSLPDKPIQKVSLFINNRKIIFQDYEMYNHLVERMFNFTPQDITSQTTTIRSIYLMGCKNNQVDIIRYNFLTKEIEELKTIFGQEYNGRSSTGWKQGILALNPLYKIF